MKPFAIPEPRGARRVVVAMSGGVDSSLAALLLLEAGWRPRGVFLRLFDPPPDAAAAQAAVKAQEAAPAVDAAAAVARHLDIPFEILDLRTRFETEIVQPFCQAYRAGRTPNPCVACNPGLKLGALLDHALAQECEGVATGHYAEVAQDAESDRWLLRRPLDAAKDQTYYLYRLDQRRLARFLTPLAGIVKADARRLAHSRGLPVADRAESQEICFVPDDDYRAFLRLRADRDADATGGDIVDLDGRVLGRHRGVHEYTIGQRRGLGLGGLREPLYVVALRPDRREVVVGRARDLMADGLVAGQVVWGALEGLGSGQTVAARVKIRYRSEAAPARLTGLESGGGVRVDFDAPRRAVTPGQSAVFYDAASGATVLGGGVIVSAL